MKVLKQKLKKFEIHQRLDQTDIYIVEAVSAEQALKLYMENKGLIESSGSTGGWVHGEDSSIVAVDKNDNL